METCRVADCDRPLIARQFCTMHYQRFQRLGTTDMAKWPKVCMLEGCETKHRSSGYCARHYMRIRETGSPGPVESTRRKAPQRVVSPRDGYARVRMPDHARADKAGMVLEHIPVMEAKIGRLVDWRKGEQVHHINGVKDDNRPENLELWVVSQPKGQRPDDLVAWAREILARYAA